MDRLELLRVRSTNNFKRELTPTFHPLGKSIDQITGLGVVAGVNPEGI